MLVEKKYRPNAAVFVTDGQGRVLLCTRIDGTPFLQTVQGGIDEGETAQEAAIREMTEELGVPAEVVEIVATASNRHRYEWPAEKRLFADVVGQEQQYFLAKVNPDTNFILDAHHQEFLSVRWGSPTELIEKSWPPKTEGFRRALEEFGLLPNDE